MKRIKSGSFELHTLKPWELAEKLLPQYNKNQFDDLEEFIKAGGQLAPIIVSEDLRIIDGYNRWRTANRLLMRQIECDVYSYNDEKEMEQHAIVLNSKRRHLSNLQVARAAARLSELFLEPQPAVDAVEEVSPEQIPTTSEKITVAASALHALPNETAKALKQASKKLRVPQATIEKVKKVDSTADSQLISAMENKVLSLKDAAVLAELETDERHQRLAEIIQEKISPIGDSSIRAVLNACNSCSSRLKSSFNKLDFSALSQERSAEIRASISDIVREAQEMLLIIDNPNLAKKD
ncbi:MAG: ParB/RepB/Spo0J family partition protein [Lentisphaeria bacterium]